MLCQSYLFRFPSLSLDRERELDDDEEEDDRDELELLDELEELPDDPLKFQENS